ncbi:hypothetical protein PLICRDRAFT_279190 [Plicaturopsis crispa FD-325 SS-3]|nr:hypothetical protein PLICRDRAFT_279190 [Plicaturopsis crispa FD-325 SS-3]
MDELTRVARDFATFPSPDGVFCLDVDTSRAEDVPTTWTSIQTSVPPHSPTARFAVLEFIPYVRSIATCPPPTPRSHDYPPPPPAAESLFSCGYIYPATVAHTRVAGHRIRVPRAGYDSLPRPDGCRFGPPLVNDG